MGMLLLGLLYSPATGSGPSISDQELNITFDLPGGFEPVPDYHSPPNHEIRYAFRRANSDGQSALCVLVEPLRGKIRPQEMSQDEAQKLGDIRLYREKWKSLDLQVLAIKKTQGDITLITRTVQIPIGPRAIQLYVIGVESQDVELAQLTRTLLGSLDGPIEWETRNRRAESLVELITGTLQSIVVIAVVVLVLVLCRTYSFQGRLLKLGFPKELAKQKICPSGAWYLPGVYLLYFGTCGGGVICLASIYDAAGARPPSSVALSLCLLSLLVSSVLIGVVMWRRVRHKRRILASYPPPPTPEITS